MCVSSTCNCLVLLQVKEEGYEVAHDGHLVTVFSAPNYCDQMGNKGAFVRFNGNDMVPHFTTFEVGPAFATHSVSVKCQQSMSQPTFWAVCASTRKHHAWLQRLQTSVHVHCIIKS